MATDNYWATAPFPRLQQQLFSSTLDEAIAPDHPVRAFELIMVGLDWHAWEAAYPHIRGRPPIHPRKLASLLLYGLTIGLRSSRDLEETCQTRLDCMWLMEGLVPDHSTICGFRTANQKQLKSLFRQICLLAAEMGLVRLNRVAIDGTTIRANNGRYRTLTREKIEKRQEELDQQIAQMLQEAAVVDQDENQRLGDKSNRLPPELQDLEQCKQKLKEALETIGQLEAAKKDGSKSPAQLPETDPDSRVLLNKTGGYAPNYTCVVSTDATCGFIVDTVTIQGNAEGEQALPATQRITETFGRAPDATMADGNFAHGHVLEGYEEQQLNFYSPLDSSEVQPRDAAYREDPTQPVPEEKWDELPYRDRKKTQLDKSAFIYVAEEDVYYCPNGRPLSFVHTDRETRSGQQVETRRYQADDCSGCPLASRCLGGGKTRTIRRDQYADVRERHVQKMQTEKAQDEYQHRMGIVEPSFGTVKGNWNFRQFLLRGLQKVDTEWRWVCLALNIMKIVTHGGALRAHVATES